MDQESQHKGIQLPALLITGKILCVKKRKNSIQSSESIEKQPSTNAMYRIDILVKEKHGDPYMVPNTAFDVGMLDLNNPQTKSWFKQILQEKVVDFSEGLPFDACLYSGEDPITAHNRYPELRAKINWEFVEEWKSSLVGKEKEDPKRPWFSS
ncbi:unnamed protein product [Fraxinus pennsylvanica]|uniref:Uncharacterized protein n=1 Tax=Fraxinus pennsylvanica TaxID=56036 RepID=A0AAD2EB54_9LAMI|nr:unnamed protein product [Fraxinus pennsylvanica]